MSTTLTKPMTAAELLMMPDDGYRYELISGELKKMSPAGHKHGSITVNLTAPLHQFVKKNKLGVVYAAETGFMLQRNPDTVLAPDIAFVRQEKVVQMGERAGFFDGPPDLAVEVTSPGDTALEMENKVTTWLSFGTRQVWVVNPKKLTVTIFRSITDFTILDAEQVLVGSDVLPGFELAVKDIFAS